MVQNGINLNCMKQEIIDLIEIAIADGEITEKERSIILRKAEALGEDEDEVEMILEGKLAMLKKQAKPIMENAGNIIKCPQCKADIPSFSTKCEYCGHEFRNLERSKTVRDLLDELMSVDKGKTFFRSGGLFDMASQEDNDRMAKEATERKVQIINLFPVPNSKEDILEFLSVGIPNAKQVKKGISSYFSSERWTHASNSNVISQQINKAWKSKCEQIIMKAKFSMKNDPKTLAEITYYAEQLNIK